MADQSFQQQLNEYLASQLKIAEAQLAQYNPYTTLAKQTPTPSMVNGLPVESVEQNTQQSSTSKSLTSEQQLLLTMYDEFVNTDDGKALSANLTKFARFVQSKVAKTSRSDQE